MGKVEVQTNETNWDSKLTFTFKAVEAVYRGLCMYLEVHIVAQLKKYKHPTIYYI